jgi:hypothetical protein
MNRQEGTKVEGLRRRKERMAEVAINGAGIAFGSFCATLGLLLATAIFGSMQNRNKAEITHAEKS